jgi:hypothetical protein
LQYCLYSFDTTFTAANAILILHIPHYIAKFIHCNRVFIVAIAIIILMLTNLGTTLMTMMNDDDDNNDDANKDEQ